MIQAKSNVNSSKVMLVTHYYPAYRGGVEIVAGQLAKRLSQNYHFDIKWIASNVDSTPTKVDGLTFLPVCNYNWIEKKLSIPYPLLSISSIITLWQSVNSVDIIHLHDYLYMSNLVTFIFGKITRKPIVITQHIGFIPYKNPLFRHLLSFLNNTLGCLILKNACQVIFISEVVQKYFTNKTSFNQLALMIPNGVDTKIFRPADNETRIMQRKALGLPIDKPIFIFVGRFVEKKGLLLLQKLAQKFFSVHWVFAGWGVIDPETWNLPNVKVFRDRQGLSLQPLYQAADLFVLPSKGEGFPLVVQESMACGTPVLVASETSNAYSPAQHLLFSASLEEPNALENWVKKINTLLEDLPQLITLRQDVAQFAEKHWSWERCSQAYAEIFQELAIKKVGINPPSFLV
jgi:glycosyltransferase involved in cell wall biosynthesis